MSNLLSYLLKIWTQLRSSYWFIPSVMALASIMVSSLIIYLEQENYFPSLKELGWLYSNQPEGARSVLATIAGSMITVASVTFSMTLLSVSHASSQIGPRILSQFMEDRGHQFTLGTFIATFIYSLLVLRTVRGGEGQDYGAFIPHLAIMMAIVLALLSIVVLIYFIHHVPNTISMTHAIDEVGKKLLNQLHSFYPEKKTESIRTLDASSYIQDFKDKPSFILQSNRKGYIEYLDIERLLKLAQNKNVVVETLLLPGAFVAPQLPLFKIYGAASFDDNTKVEFENVCISGSSRSTKQDILHPTDLLIEVAARALSPGINDPYTAIDCINQLKTAIIELMSREEANPLVFDKLNNLRIITSTIKVEDYLNKVFDSLRSYVKRDTLTILHELECLRQLITFTDNLSYQRCFENQIQYLFQAAQESINDPRDIQLIEDICN